MEVMMQLGEFQFGLETAAYQEFTRSTAYTWAAQTRFGKDDALQFTGNGSDTITLPGVVYPEFRGGTEQINDMRALAEQRFPQMLIDGRGNLLGEWVIEGVEENGTVFAQAGVARKQEFTLKLRRFQDDDFIGGVLSGFVPPDVVLPSIENSAASVAASASNGSASLLTSLGASLATVSGMAAQIGSETQSILTAINGGINAATRLRNGGIDAIQQLAGVRSIADIPSTMGSLARLGGSVSAAAGAQASVLKRAGIDLTSSGVDPAAINAVRDSMITINRVNVLAVNVRSTALSIIGRAG